MSWLNYKFLFDATVLVATLQFATSKGQSEMADDKNHENQFSLGLIGTKEGKKKHYKKKVPQRAVDYYKKRFLTDQLISSPVFLNNGTKLLQKNLPKFYLLKHDL